jgi:RimJ/RimL family protein N-acetyltransferase
MFLKHNDLVIRNATAYDALLLCKWWNDGKIMAHAGYPNGLGITEQEILKKLEIDNDFNRRLILEISAIPVGEMNYRTVENNVAEIGIKICEWSQQGKGYGTTFLMMLINALFNEMGYYKILLDTNSTNTRAQHVYEKIGFRKIAVRHNSWSNQFGKLQTSIDYELNRSQFNDVLN